MSKKYPCPAGREDDCGYPACAHDRQCELAASTVKNDMKITIEDFKEYVAGFLIVGEDDGLSYQNMLSALHNAYSQLMDDQDGIEALTERRRNSHNHIYRGYNGTPLEITDLNEIQYLFDFKNKS